MLNRPLSRLSLLSLLLATLAACTTVQGPQTATPDTQQGGNGGVVESAQDGAAVTATGADTSLPQEGSALPPPPSGNAAVIALLDSAQADASSGRLPSATAALERALRIEPRNPHLWHQMAQLKLQKGDYLQAESFAARSNSWAGSNKLLQAKNWRLISEARSLRGDNAGAKSALARARALENSRQ